MKPANMNSEQKVSEQFQQYKELADKNKNIDLARLMISTLEQARREEVAAKKQHQAYLVSVGLPPFGLFFAAYYYFSDKPGGKHVAINCLILTGIALLIAWGITSLLMSSMGSTAGQLPAINAEDIRSLYQ
jgi:hypothetical protein